MGKKILLGGILGGIVVFLVSSIFHMATQLGEEGVKPVPNEEAVLANMSSSIHDAGFYYFPQANMSPGRTKEQKQADQATYLAKYKQGPTGILIYSPGGKDFNFGRLLGNQFLFGLVASFLLSWILAVTAGATSYGTRVLIVIVAALFGGIVYSLPYWNWYDFPTNYIIAEIGTMVVSWAAAGLAMAAVVKKQASA